MRHNSTKWIWFLTNVRSNFITTGRSLRNSEPFADTCFRFYSRSWKNATEFGLERLYLRTFTGGISRTFSLTEQNGHLHADTRTIPLVDGLEESSSRAHAMYGLVDPSGELRRIQVVAHHKYSGTESKKEIEGFCNYLVQEFVLQERNGYFQLIEEGSKESRRLLQMTRKDAVLPGTAALTLTNKISKSISAKLGVFCIVGSDKFFIEYANLNNKRSRPVIAKGAELIVSDPATYDTLMSDLMGHFAVKIKTSHTLHKEFNKVISNLIQDIAVEKEELWAVPIEYDQQILGILLFTFPVASYGFSDAAYSLTKLAAEALSGPSRYLYQRRLGKLIVDPLFTSRETRITSNQGFLIMPFEEAWSDDVAAIVREVLATVGIAVVRADEMHGENVMEDVWTAILSSQYVVADVTGRNPNVYYELGIAHTLGKKVILLTQNITDIPFDTRHLRHIVYSNDLSGHQSIKAGIKGFVSP